jgi:dTDP-4-dehydrorhamnose reductase
MFILSGSNSLLGRNIAPILRDRFQVCAFDADRGDLRDREFMKQLIGEIKPEIFINCHQFDNIEECEYKRDQTYSINSSAVGDIAGLCRENNILLVQISSSYVFDGAKGSAYNETDAANPLQAYGDSKLLAEKLIGDAGCRHLIVRLPDLFGTGHSFLHRIFSMLNVDKKISVIKGQYVSPTSVIEAAGGIINLIEKKCEGIYHFANDGAVTVKDFIAQAAGLFIKYCRKDFVWDVNEVGYDEFLSPVERPLYGVLGMDKYKKSTGAEVRGWKEALDLFMKKNCSEL